MSLKVLSHPGNLEVHVQDATNKSSCPNLTLLPHTKQREKNFFNGNGRLVSEQRSSKNQLQALWKQFRHLAVAAFVFYASRGQSILAKERRNRAMLA